MARRLHNKKKKKSSPIRIGETATPERRKQHGGVTTEIVDRDATGKATITRHKAKLECVLDFYLRTRRIDDPQHAAGIKLRGIYKQVSHGFDSSNFSGALLADTGNGNHEKQIAAYLDSIKKLKKLYARLTPAQRRVLRDVCGYDEYAKDKDEKETLVRGLDRLAIHWGFTTKDKTSS
jgi:hypothetical protein